MNKKPTCFTFIIEVKKPRSKLVMRQVLDHLHALSGGGLDYIDFTPA